MFDELIAGPTGVVVPTPRVWVKHGLEHAALREAEVQRLLRAAHEKQARYFEHLMGLFDIYVDEETLQKGKDAVAEALPDRERTLAASWAASPKWDKLMGEHRVVLRRRADAKGNHGRGRLNIASRPDISR